MTEITIRAAIALRRVGIRLNLNYVGNPRLAWARGERLLLSRD